MAEKIIIELPDFQGPFNIETIDGLPNMAGVYFLFDKNKTIIYIGKTVHHIRNRVITHLSVPCEHSTAWTNKSAMENHNERRKEIIYYGYYELDKNITDMVESYFINKYLPKYNFQGVYSYMIN